MARCRPWSASPGRRDQPIGHIRGQVIPLRLSPSILEGLPGPSSAGRLRPGRPAHRWEVDNGSCCAGLDRLLLTAAGGSWRRDGGQVTLDNPGRVRSQLDVVPIHGVRAPLEAAAVVPLQPFLVLRPYVRGHGLHVELGLGQGGLDDHVEGRGDEPEGAVGRQEAQGLDVQRSIVRVYRDFFCAAHDPAYDLWFLAFVGPRDDSGEAAFAPFVGGTVVEEVAVGDLEQETVYPF